ncbi:putative N-acetyltransferase HLS1 [Wolffia australiana]
MAGEERISVREFEPERDSAAVEEMERRCEVSGEGDNGEKTDKSKMKKKKKKEGTSLLVDLLGDPLCRVRYFPDHVMLIAEYGAKKEMAGVIRACVKTVTRGSKEPDGSPAYSRVAYILGLRVSPQHRRMGVATRLVAAAEEWCKKEGGAEYAYMATERSNAASLNLFTAKFSYTPFRFASVLVQPVHAHPMKLSNGVTVLRLAPPFAESFYRRVFSSSEFFPKDIGAILNNPLSLGTFLAVPSWAAADYESHPPASFAVMSLWNSKEMFRMQLTGGSAAAKAVIRWCRAADERLPWARIPSLPDLFRPFGMYFMYGLHAEGGAGALLVRALCRLAHNLAREDRGCAAVVTELARADPARAGVPHWRKLSWDEDVWCMKSLAEGPPSNGDDEDYGNWARSQPSAARIFVDPRDF